MAVMKGLFGDERAQMTVELCTVIPVCLIVAAIVMNALTFFSECATFDRIGRNAVRIAASSPADGESTSEMEAKILQLIESEMEGAQVTCEVRGRQVGDGLGASVLGFTTFELTYAYAPTLFGLTLRSSIFGISLPELHHSVSLAVDSYTPGRLLD